MWSSIRCLPRVIAPIRWIRPRPLYSVGAGWRYAWQLFEPNDLVNTWEGARRPVVREQVAGEWWTRVVANSRIISPQRNEFKRISNSTVMTIERRYQKPYKNKKTRKDLITKYNTTKQIPQQTLQLICTRTSKNYCLVFVPFVVLFVILSFVSLVTSPIGFSME